MSTPGAVKGAVGVATQVLDVVETADKSGHVSFFRLCVGYFFKVLLVVVCLAHMHVIFLLWILPFYIQKCCKGGNAKATNCTRWYGRIMSAASYVTIPVSIIIIATTYLTYTKNWGWASTGVGWLTWGICVMILYFVDAYNKKFKIDQLSLRVYGVNKNLLKTKVRSDNESLQFLWICALVSIGPMLVIGWITDYIYIEFFSNSAWHFVCEKKDANTVYALCGDAQNLSDICCKLEFSNGYPSYLDLIIRISTTFVISWGLVKFIAEWILTSESKINNLQEKNLGVTAQNLQLLSQLQEEEKEKEKEKEQNKDKSPELQKDEPKQISPPPQTEIGNFQQKAMDKVIAANLELIVPSPSDEENET